jgi:hypothetical protein
LEVNSGLITIAVEGDTDVPVIQRVLRLVGLQVHVIHGLKGKNWLDQQLTGYNNAARYARWLVLRDLDRDATCAPELVARLLPKPGPMMCFRIAVRAVEAWLLSDREQMSRFLGLSQDKIPADSEQA